MRGWGGLPKILQKGVEQNRGEETKTFKKRGGGAGTPLQTMNRFFRFLLNSFFFLFFWLIWLISVQQILPTIAENIIFTKNSC